MIKLTYITHYAKIPSREADGICVIKTCSALAENGIQVELIIPREQNTSLEELSGGDDLWDFYQVCKNFKLTYLPSKFLYSLGFFGRAIYKILSVIYALLKTPTLIYARHLEIAFLAILFGKPTILAHHDISLIEGSILLAPIFRMLKNPKRKAGVLTVTNNGANRLIEMGMPKSRILVAPNGVTLENFHILQSRAEIRNSLHLPKGKTIIGFSGNMYLGRGVEELIEAATQYPAKHFLMLGGFPDDIKRHKNYASDLNANNIEFAGFVPQKLIPKYLMACDILIMPYTTRTSTHKYMSPMKMFDYLAAGKPIIATDFPVIREILQDKINAVLILPDSATAIAQAIQWVLDHPERAQEIAIQAKVTAGNYTWDKRAAHITKWIEAILQ